MEPISRTTTTPKKRSTYCWMEMARWSPEAGVDGLTARFPAKPGDAYFFRLNCTAGFYNGKQSPAHILAVRSLYPKSDR